MADREAAAPAIVRLAREPGGAAPEAELSRVAALHRRVLPHTASSRAGNGAVSALYRALLVDPSAAVLLAAAPATDEGAFAAGTIHLQETERAVRRAVSADRGLAFRLALLNLLSPAHLAARAAWDRRLPSPPAGYVLTIGATDASPVRGRDVLRALEKQLAAAGAADCWVDTEASNERALAFYARNGYATVVRRFGQVLLRKRLASGPGASEPGAVR